MLHLTILYLLQSRLVPFVWKCLQLSWLTFVKMSSVVFSMLWIISVVFVSLFWWSWSVNKINGYRLSGVMRAWVTMAPRGLSASLESRRPICRSQTPTQPRVTVTARPAYWHRLTESIWSSWRSITWTCSKMLLMFHTLTVLSIDDVITCHEKTHI